jgi:hypothetical protein
VSARQPGLHSRSLSQKQKKQNSFVSTDYRFVRESLNTPRKQERQPSCHSNPLLFPVDAVCAGSLGPSSALLKTHAHGEAMGGVGEESWSE